MSAEPVPGEGSVFELTRGQQMMWTGQRLQADDPLYNMALCFEIDGVVEPTLFRAAFQALVARCDNLRTVLDGDPEAPRQRVCDQRPYEVALVDLSDRPDPRQALRAWSEDRARHRLDLFQCSFDSVLLKLGEARHAWFYNQHHVMTDASAVAVLFERMQHFYGLAREGRLEEAETLPEYRDYVARLAGQRDSSLYRKAQAYWQEHLAQPAAPTSFYRRTPRDRSGRTTRIPCDLGTERSARLRALASSERFSAFTAEMSVFQIFATALFAYLHRVSGNNALAIGTPSHNRASAKLKQTAGLFIEMLPLQVRIEAGESFEQLFDTVAEAARGLLLNAVPGASDFQHNRAFDVVLNFITASFGDFDGMPMRSRWVHAGHGDRNHLLRLQVQDFDRRGDYGLYFDLNEDTFVGAEREWVAQHFLRLLDAFLDDPAKAIDTVALLSESEGKRLLADLGPAPTEAACASTVLALVDEQIRRCPRQTALECAGHSVDYAELGRRSEHLARQLRTLDVQAGERVALWMPRSIDAVVAILGVLRAGCAYVPIDADYPVQRVAFILDDADARFVICGEGQQTPPEAAEARALRLDQRSALPEIAPAEGALPQPRPDDVAYLIYTSGSTGRPKGVVVGHDNLFNYVQWAARHYTRGDSLAFPLFSSLAFDLTVTSIFVPLASGGRVVIYPPPAEGREITIHRIIDDNAVDIIKLTPAHLALVQSLDLSKSRLRALILGGEDLKTDLSRTISRYFGDHIEIYNEYGPTEATVGCMIHRFDPQRDVHASVPIGRAISNLQVHVLDAGLNPVPPGVTGELYIGGAGVARGYLGRAELTAQRFVADPFRPGARLYRSGDLARWDPDGVMEYLGRVDHQVKVRGVRIELGEIEGALLERPEISECAVLLVERSVDAARQEEHFCVRCGLSSKHPEAIIDDEGVCRVCRGYDAERERASAYFRDLDELRAMIGRIKAEATGTHDSMMLLSGGKDSTYALAQLVDLGLRPLVFTLDNGFISEGAKANIRRIVDKLGLDLIEGTTEAMNEIFADSLRRFSNVCNGCFKVIYTLSTKLAHEHGIRHVFTGLSRGQMFETRIAGMFRQQVFDADAIDRTVIEARKAYHRMDDAVAQHLDVSLFRDDAIFDEVHYIDFYRYCDVELDEVYRYLGERIGWTRPKDTGRSTNCLINEAGIHVHKRERGYHNYALPYSWDVRLGHKQRDAALAELDDEIDEENVGHLLGEVGYDLGAAPPASLGEKFLVAYYASGDEIPASELKAWLASRLPDEFVPRRFVRLDALPLTGNGKLDRDVLPAPDSDVEREGDYRAPRSDTEKALAAIWSQVLGVNSIGTEDSFFELGGDSILNIQIVARAARAGIVLTPQQIFDYPTIAELARVAGSAKVQRAEQGAIEGPSPLTPIQRRFFELDQAAPQEHCQSVLLDIREPLDSATLRQAFAALLAHHDGLRSRFEQGAEGWRQHIQAPAAAAADFDSLDIGELDRAAQDAAIEAAMRELPGRLDHECGKLVAARCFGRGDQRPAQLLIAIHHLVVDGVSWWVLLDDLEALCAQLGNQQSPKLPAKTSSIKAWGEALAAHALTPQLQSELAYWRRAGDSATPLPLDHPQAANDRSAAATVSAELGEDDTGRLLQEIPAAFHTQVPDLILAALLETLTDWAGGERLRVDLEGHGREDIGEGLDLLRTVGWLTSLYPVTLARTPGEDAIATLRSVKRQLREVPGRGLGYGVLRYLAGDETLQRQPQAELLFNYLGQWDQTLAESKRFGFARPIMASAGDQGSRQHLLEINAVIFEGRLRMDWTYADRHEAATIETLAARTLSSLHALIAACLGSAGQSLAAEDFPSADLDQQDLDELIADFGESPE